MARKIKVIIEDFDTGHGCEGIITIAKDNKHFPKAIEFITPDNLAAMVVMLNTELNFKLRQNIEIVK